MEGVLVLYASATGNTEKVARAIARALGVRALDVRDASPEDIRRVQLIFVGSGVYFLKPSRRLARFIRELPSLAGVKAAVFGTYGAEPSQIPLLRKLLEERGAEVIGEFSCPGRDVLALGLLRRGRPDEGDLKRAQDFATEMARKARL